MALVISSPFFVSSPFLTSSSIGNENVIYLDPFLKATEIFIRCTMLLPLCLFESSFLGESTWPPFHISRRTNIILV